MIVHGFPNQISALRVSYGLKYYYITKIYYFHKEQSFVLAKCCLNKLIAFKFACSLNGLGKILELLNVYAILQRKTGKKSYTITSQYISLVMPKVLLRNIINIFHTQVQVLA